VIKAQREIKDDPKAGVIKNIKWYIMKQVEKMVVTSSILF